MKKLKAKKQKRVKKIKSKVKFHASQVRNTSHSSLPHAQPRISPSFQNSEINQQLNIASQYGQQGRLDLVEAICRNILEKYPEEPRALHLLSLVALQQNKLTEALDYLHKAIQYNPTASELYNQLGVIYCQLKEYDKGIEYCQKAITLKPNLSEGYYNLGLAYQHQKSFEMALTYYQKALLYAPQQPTLQNQIGNVLQEMGKIKESLNFYKKAVSLAPNRFDYIYNQASALKLAGEIEASERAYLKAIQLKPDYKEAINNLGVLYLETNRFDQAKQQFEKILSLQPTFIPAIKNAGDLESKLENYQAAASYYYQGLQIEPDNLELMNAYIFMLKSDCEWQPLEEWSQRLIKITQEKLLKGEECFTSPFSSLSLWLTGEQQLLFAQSHAKRIFHSILPKEKNFLTNLNIERKLKIGYVSADFRDHPVAHLISGVLEHHDRNHFEIIAFSLGPDDKSIYRERIKNACDQFIDFYTVDNQKAIEIILNSKVDILIDLMGYTNYARLELFAHRLAPIQIGYLGYPGTSGTNFMDYYIADETVLPLSEIHTFSEKIIYLPDTYFAADNKLVIDQNIPDRASCGLPEEAIVYCCFCTHYKLEPIVFDAWMKILQQVSNSVLWLFSRNSIFENNLRKKALKYGIVPERLIFAYRETKEKHLARHVHADIFLDTFIYNAHTTATDALWAGVPLITIVGNTFARKVSASLLKAIEMPELIAPSIEAYIQLAVNYGLDKNALIILKQKLQEKIKSAPLFNTALYTKNLEKAYQKAWNYSTKKIQHDYLYLKEKESIT
jgi:predicted O-linked N-acetylglucosamine transferase (SPINDLY family)